MRRGAFCNLPAFDVGALFKGSDADAIGKMFEGARNWFKGLIGGSFATGSDYVPRDMLAKIHKGELERREREPARR